MSCWLWIALSKIALYWSCLWQNTVSGACAEPLTELLQREALLPELADGEKEECESHFKDGMCLKTSLSLAYASNRIQLMGNIITITYVFYDRKCVPGEGVTSLFLWYGFLWEIPNTYLNIILKLPYNRVGTKVQSLENNGF